MVDNNGEKVENIHHFKGNLSDFQPVVLGNKIVWYTWNNGDINFYDIKTTDLAVNHITEIHNGHQYAYDPDSDTDDTITFRCTACDAQKIKCIGETVRQPMILIGVMKEDGNRRQEQSKRLSSFRYFQYIL